MTTLTIENQTPLEGEGRDLSLRSMAVAPDGTVWTLTNQRTPFVRRYRSDTRYIGDVPAFDSLKNPAAIAFHDGNILVGDWGRNSSGHIPNVSSFSYNGNRIETLVEGCYPEKIVPFGGGIFIANAVKHSPRIKRFFIHHTDGTPLDDRVGVFDVGASREHLYALGWTSDVDDQGTISHLVVYRLEGRAFTGIDAGHFADNFSFSMAVSPEGNIAVGSLQGRLHLFDSNGLYQESLQLLDGTKRNTVIPVEQVKKEEKVGPSQQFRVIELAYSADGALYLASDSDLLKIRITP